MQAIELSRKILHGDKDAAAELVMSANARLREKKAAGATAYRAQISLGGSSAEAYAAEKAAETAILSGASAATAKKAAKSAALAFSATHSAGGEHEAALDAASAAAHVRVSGGSEVQAQAAGVRAAAAYTKAVSAGLPASIASKAADLAGFAAGPPRIDHILFCASSSGFFRSCLGSRPATE